MKIFLAAVLIVLMAAVAFGLLALLWWWLLPLAFPGLAAWTYLHALAFNAVVLLIWTPTIVS